MVLGTAPERTFASRRRTAVIGAGMAVAILATSSSCGRTHEADDATTTSTPTTAAANTRAPAAVPTTVVVTSTSTSDASVTETSILSGADLRPCGDDTSYNTTPDWVLGTPPDGHRLDRATTTVNHYATESEFDSAVVSTLAETDAAGRISSAITLLRFADLADFEPQPGTAAGHAFEDSGSDSVRGHDGRIGRVVHRGDLDGWPEARWTEGDAGWVARSSDLDVNALATALGPLDLSDGSVRDPGGRFALVGTASVWQDETRETTIKLVGTDAGGAGTTLDISVTRMPDDARGLGDVGAIQGDLSGSTGLALARHGERWILSSGSTVVTTLADGSLVSLDHRTSAGSGPALTGAELIALADQLHRVDPDDPYTGPLATSLATMDQSSWDQFCSETAAG